MHRAKLTITRVCAGPGAKTVSVNPAAARPLPRRFEGRAVGPTDRPLTDIDVKKMRKRKLSMINCVNIVTTTLTIIIVYCV